MKDRLFAIFFLSVSVLVCIGFLSLGNGRDYEYRVKQCDFKSAAFESHKYEYDTCMVKFKGQFVPLDNVILN